METKNLTSRLPLITSFIILIAVVSPLPASAYTNHTVGGAAGWFFNADTGTPAAKYSDWATNQTFNLGDYLIFKTSTNQSVIQTYNATTYKNCSIDYSEDDDTFSFTSGNNKFNQSLTIAVPLTINGTNYYFSDSDDGVQCEQGMAFEIVVKYGSGLPPSLNQPPPPAYVEPSPPVPDETTPPPSTGVRTTIANLPWLVSFVTLCGMIVLME
ncbi:cucumber peeling cupredoxin-like [Heracleum sosnowskyi]|uniref:Cucumber peeling cupredoxin-like n=1 Tax=Heracleum sosnowskyi TaxID=360622 RepID=A0AAD8I0K9_9APIA|nr:cucumber peeling cupredoxin-like [Heracleum sosnowskyi]